MEQQGKPGRALVAMLLLGLLCAVVFAFARSNFERRQRNEHERGSLANAERVQEVADIFAERNERYPTADELDRLMELVRPLYKGVLNTRTNLPTEPRTVRAMEPGALIYAVSEDCCTDTITVIGEDRTVIWTIVGRVRGGTVIYGAAPPTRPEYPRRIGGTFPNS